MGASLARTVTCQANLYIGGQMHGARIALIFFSRTARQESLSKPWMGVSRPGRNLAIMRELADAARGHAKRSGLDLHHFHEDKQRGGHFGERLANAFADVFAMGYEGAVAVGNDCPDLSKIDWEGVRARMEEGQTALGPDFRGGAYLIGLPAQDFDASQLAALPWQSPNLLASLVALVNRGGDCCLLPQLLDLNSPHDLQEWIGRQVHACGRRIRALLLMGTTWAMPPLVGLAGAVIGPAALRGPPSCA